MMFWTLRSFIFFETSSGNISSSMVFPAILFKLFGSFLGVTGGSRFFIDFAIGATGGKRGGPAKAALFQVLYLVQFLEIQWRMWYQRVFLLSH
nr:TRAP transporter large permease subunit [Cytobacillus firmus]